MDNTKILVHAFITCKLDNCLLYGLPSYLIHRLQLVQNCVARLIMCRNKYDHITPILKELHWIPVQQRIIFRILLIIYKALDDLAPIYISNLLTFCLYKSDLEEFLDFGFIFQKRSTD